MCHPLYGSYVGNGAYSSERLNGNPNMNTLTRMIIPVLLFFVCFFNNRFTQIYPNIYTR